jgi:hypothetical protein
MILISGTVANTVQLQTLKNKWQQKKESGDVLSKKERNERENWTSDDWMKHNYEEQLAQNRESGRQTEISSKIMSGETLTPDEEKYLEQNNPTQLQKYRQIRAEKKAYEEKLKKCKTKDEVQKIKTETLGEYMASMKKTDNDPYIPVSEKLAKAQEIMAKMKIIQEVEEKFMRSQTYKNLPTEAEKSEESAKEHKLENEQITQEIKENAKDSEELNEETGGKIQTDDAGEASDVVSNYDYDEFEKDIGNTIDRLKLKMQLERESNREVSTDEEKKVGQKADFSV